MTEKRIVQEHLQKLSVDAVMVTPSHPERSNDKVFEQAKRQLKKDNFYKCWVCNSERNLQVHHWWAEWSEDLLIDKNLLKSLCDNFDIYGYSKKMHDIPITEISDIRQLMVLCEEHHIGNDSTDGGTPTGIHFMPLPYWILQKVCKKGLDPIPQESETLEFTEEKIKKFIDNEVLNEQNEKP